MPQTRPRLLVIDIGNTSATFALYKAGSVSRIGHLNTGASRDAAHVIRALGLYHQAIDGIAVASVVPQVNNAWRKALRTLWPDTPPLWIHQGLSLGVALAYRLPETLGADRLADLSGAAARFKAPIITIDFGTATVFNVITPKGFTGGVIAPGAALMLDYLHDRTALLPQLEIPTRPLRPSAGRNTAEQMLLAVQWGYTGMVKEILSHLTRPFRGRVTICATGGWARRSIRLGCLPIPVLPNLTLEGTGRIWELNIGPKISIKNKLRPSPRK